MLFGSPNDTKFKFKVVSVSETTSQSGWGDLQATPSGRSRWPLEVVGGSPQSPPWAGDGARQPRDTTRGGPNHGPTSSG
jgi:hypothetical protein